MITLYQVAYLMQNLVTYLLIFLWIRLQSSDLSSSNQVFTHCHHRSVQISFSVDPSVIKNPRDTEQHEENHMSCTSVQNTLFHGIHRSCTENMDTDTVEITIQWFLSPVMTKAVIRLLITSCELYREFKNYPPISNLFFISKCIAKALLLQLSTFFADQNLLCT